MAEKKVLQAFRSQSRLTIDHVKPSIDKILEGFTKIYERNASSLSFEELYRTTYNLIVARYGDQLYEAINDEIIFVLKKETENLLRCSDYSFLKLLQESFGWNETSGSLTAGILMYMDKTYCDNGKTRPTVRQLFASGFTNQVILHPILKERMISLVLALIRKDRASELVDTALIGQILLMLQKLGKYEELFEVVFLDETRNFYEAEAVQYLQINSCPEYLERVEKRYTDEQSRAHNYLQLKTGEKIKKILEDEMILKYYQTLVDMPNGGCKFILQEDRRDDLRLMYKLFVPAPCKASLQGHVVEFLKYKSEHILSNNTPDRKPIDDITDLLHLHAQLNEIMHYCFNNDSTMRRVVEDGFKTYLNKNNWLPFNLAMAMDTILRKPAKAGGQDEDDIDLKMENYLKLFSYIISKDVFESFYRERLAKRLLSGRSVAEDTETNIVRMLKSECGQIFTTKLEGMFKDLRLSKKTMEQYNDPKENNRMDVSNNNTAIELSVTTVATGFWPTEGTSMSCRWPKELTEKSDDFTEFYVNKHTGRVIKFHPAWGTAIVRATFPAHGNLPVRKHELTVSTIQTIILLMFNRGASFSLREICDATGVDPKELELHLRSLSAPKFRILVKDSSGMSEETKFSVNDGYMSKFTRVVIPLLSVKTSGVQEMDMVPPEKVEQARGHSLEAAIVRIMKTRKTLSHNLLVAEVTKQMAQRFSPSPQDIKRRIENLIDRDYLERDPDDRTTYKYNA